MGKVVIRIRMCLPKGLFNSDIICSLPKFDMPLEVKMYYAKMYNSKSLLIFLWAQAQGK